jgi:hypothetical protein
VGAVLGVGSVDDGVGLGLADGESLGVAAGESLGVGLAEGAELSAGVGVLDGVLESLPESELAVGELDGVGSAALAGRAKPPIMTPITTTGVTKPAIQACLRVK